MRTRLRAADIAAEAIGTFALTFVAAGAACTDAYTGGELGVAGLAISYGLALAALVTALGHVSGAHLNPAVTVAAWLTGSVGPAVALAYACAQVAGGLAAGGLLRAVFAADVWQDVALGAPQLGPGVTAGTGLLIEAVLAGIVVFVVLQVAADERAPRHVYGLAIGAALAACAYVGQPLAGGAMNPARAFGPALASGHLENWSVWWLGQPPPA